jgi:hypothetical protein
MVDMKRRHRGTTTATVRGPREIHVRLTAPQVAVGPAPEVWVVNGRVIRFLDPSRPDVETLPRERLHRFGRLRGFAHGFAHR